MNIIFAAILKIGMASQSTDRYPAFFMGRYDLRIDIISTKLSFHKLHPAQIRRLSLKSLPLFSPQMQNPADLLRAESFYAIIIKKVYHNTCIDNEVLSGTGGLAMIDVKLLTLLKVYETGNYTRAAEQLALTQPAVSQHIKAIEKALGVTLFMRGGGKIKPTPEGMLVIQYAERVVSLYENLQQALVDQKYRIDRLRVGITHTSESNIVTEVLAKYSGMNNNVNITIQTDTISNLYAMLKNYRIDIAIVEGQLTDPSINSIMLDTDFLVCAVSIENPLARKSMITLEELKRERLILRLPNSGTRNLFAAHLESRNISIDEFNVTLEVDNIATIKDLIRRNYGVSILPRSACMDEFKKGKMQLLPIENLSMTREMNILYHHSFTHQDVLQDIVRIYNDSVRIYQSDNI